MSTEKHILLYHHYGNHIGAERIYEAQVHLMVCGGAPVDRYFAGTIEELANKLTKRGLFRCKVAVVDCMGGFSRETERGNNKEQFVHILNRQFETIARARLADYPHEDVGIFIQGKIF